MIHSDWVMEVPTQSRVTYSHVLCGVPENRVQAEDPVCFATTLSTSSTLSFFPYAATADIYMGERKRAQYQTGVANLAPVQFFLTLSPNTFGESSTNTDTALVWAELG